MEYRVDDRSLSGETFLDFVQQVWPGAYNLEQTRAALSKTMNFTAWDGGQLAGCLRVLTDGCFFGTITELLVLPAYQRQGIGSRLLRLAAAHTSFSSHGSSHHGFRNLMQFENSIHHYSLTLPQAHRFFFEYHHPGRSCRQSPGLSYGFSLPFSGRSSYNF